MRASNTANGKSEMLWFLSLIPLYIAIGSPGLLTTLVALSLDASVAEIGIMTASGAIATIVFSSVWGRLSDFSGKRKIYLLFLFIALGPIFLALNMANSIYQLILLYTILNSITSGISPIAIMYTVECCRNEDWQNGVAKYNSITSTGNLLGLLTYTFIARFFETRWLFSIAAAMCFLAGIVLWRMGEEPEITLERHPFAVRVLHDVERFFSPKLFWHHVMDLKRLKIPKKIQDLKPLHLLFLAAFVHWTGVNLFGVGQIPLMSDLGLSDSLILAINGSAAVASAIAFITIAPRIKSNHGRLIKRVTLVRGCLILCWATFPIFFLYPISFIFILPLILSIIWNIFYTMIWLPISTYAISKAPADRKGSIQGELLSATGVANATGSALGGIVITTFGYTVGFVLASIIALLAIPIISRIDITD